MKKELEEKQGKSFLWFLYVVFIPLLFAITVALVICFVAGVNVLDAAKDVGQKIPVIGTLVQKDHSKSATISDKDAIELQGQIKDREAQISQLQSSLENKNKDIKEAELENIRLQKEMDDMTKSLANNKRAFKDIIKTYETMSPKKVAPILTQMNDKEAVKILSTVKADTLAAIMENMNAKDAAKYTQFLTDGIEKNN
ncbi:MotE family protein [Neobacillus sp. PS3-40]|uniref:MotE family protein n=1 Tax=Neobacillus sp. PS3-40 TaxID=3070679 RepID=UPI0027E11944|nr:MotE family protein [Neobacillus sp. PS3-40]WML43703.1 MotE family protein [Neobacillus sp. PS3-40]